MADTYPNFAALARNERSGIDYQVRVRRARPTFALMAPHGGGIEPGTSEIADAIASDRHSFHTLEGLKSSGNAVLHITSTRFDEPMCLTVLGHTAVVVTLHGEHSEDDGEVVFVGGRKRALGDRIGAALARQGFDVRKHDDPDLQGLEEKNICNRGVQGRRAARAVEGGAEDAVRVADAGRTETSHRAVRGVRGGGPEGPGPGLSARGPMLKRLVSGPR